ncbi:membrane lipoprotein lipid attachment site-containing protein [Candidatus Gracilibacteria bacterium]|nr:membrane lipoprotein lipid attachment site-containing protein [Candidatus Gracilibacteria bacterium]MCF7819128.1 membrane lipoprotein lipid attachment site-containing protein [Candidatus Gracilibacteria bacterium]
MKKIISIFVFLFLLGGCTSSQPSDTPTQDIPSKAQDSPYDQEREAEKSKKPVSDQGRVREEECTFREGQCCRGELCAETMYNCVEGTSPFIKGCDEDCVPVGGCQ